MNGGNMSSGANCDDSSCVNEDVIVVDSGVSKTQSLLVSPPEKLRFVCCCHFYLNWKIILIILMCVCDFFQTSLFILSLFCSPCFYCCLMVGITMLEQHCLQSFFGCAVQIACSSALLSLCFYYWYKLHHLVFVFTFFKLFY